jgi:DnaJ-class molecular chaperone
VAQCTGCGGKGQTTEAMAGGPGTHTATCNKCGGSGHFGVNKPADWADEVKAEPETAVA